MVSSTKIYTLEELFELEKNNNAQTRSKWVLNTPDPPDNWNELVGFVKETILPHNNNYLIPNNQPNPSYKRLVSFLQSLFPILCWCQNYNTTKFKNDLVAGLTLASLSIPQSMAYATLANLEPQYGLYTSVVPPIIYAMLGTSRDVVIGAVAVDSLLLSSMILKLNPAMDPFTYKKLAFTVTFFAGVFQAIFGLSRLGFLVDFLSHAASIGFMAGAAIVIGLQQLKGLFGITNFTNKADIISVVKAVWRSHETWEPYNFILGFSFLSFILITRFLGRKKKLLWLQNIAPILSVILSTIIVYLTKAQEHGIKIVKEVKGGLNPSSVSELQFGGPYVGEVAKIAIIVAVVGLMEAITVGRSFASRKGYYLNTNKEMVALGVTNVVGSITSCYVATGSFSRTAVNYSAGSESLVSNIVMSITVLIALQLLTRFVYYTPQAILASIIISALPGLVDLNGAYNIWKLDKLDFLACLGAFFGVLFSGVETGVITAISMSFAKIIVISIRPETETLGRIPGTDTFGDVNQYHMAVKVPGILVIRLKSSWLCFANANSVRDRIIRWVTKENYHNFKEDNERIIKRVIIDMSSLMNIDTTGIATFGELHTHLMSHGVELAIANPRWQVIHKLKLADFVNKIGEKRVFLTIGEALDMDFSPC